jgi:hypothetical protein
MMSESSSALVGEGFFSKLLELTLMSNVSAPTAIGSRKVEAYP